MFLKKCVLASVFACLALPAWSDAVSDAEIRSDTGLTTANLHAQTALRTFIERVWGESPAVQGAQAAVEVARARGEGAGRPLYNPSLELNAERTNINTRSIGFSQTIDWSDKRGSRRAIASSEIKAAEAALMATRQRIAVEALDALARNLTARKTLELALRRAHLMNRFADTVQQRYSAGDMRALDASLARVAYSEALMQLATRESELAATEAELRAVSGLDLTSWPLLPKELAPPHEKPDETALLEALPELIVLHTRMAAARARIQLAKLERRPDPTIGIRGGRDGSENLWGLSLQIPLFVRNNFSTEVQAAAHEAFQEEQAYRNAYRRAQARIEGAWIRLQNADGAWRGWLATGQQAHSEQVTLLKQMWQAGELTATDYLIQAKQNVDTQVSATALAGEVWQAAIAWLDASGQVGRWLDITPAVSEKTTNSGELK